MRRRCVRRLPDPVASAITCAINPGSDPGKDKGLPKKAFEINYLTWLPDLGSNQGPTD
jgi:hypothetical protein